VSIRLRSAPAAGVVAPLLVLLVAGFAAAGTVLVDPASSTTTTTTATFVDTNGNGIDDTCEQDVVADPAAAAAADAAVDTDGNGTISVPEAAHSDRRGGANCNHGGYVSGVARDSGAADEQTTTGQAQPQDQTTCTPVAPPDRDPALDGQKNAHGKWISIVAQSDAIGGKNCNHGGAVSDASKADNAARKAARDAAKAAAKDAKQHGHGQAPTH
jgi:hypothetical protein